MKCLDPRVITSIKTSLPILSENKWTTGTSRIALFSERMIRKKCGLGAFLNENLSN
jgi:hypothetical protein